MTRAAFGLVCVLQLVAAMVSKPLCDDYSAPLVMRNSPGFEDRLVQGEWRELAGVLAADSTWVHDPVGAMLAGHIFLGAGEYNLATFFFHTIIGLDDLKNWELFTQRFLERHSGSAIALYLYGDALARLGEYATAEELFEKSIAKDPKCFIAYNARGLVRVMLSEKASGSIASASNPDSTANSLLSSATEDFWQCFELAPNFLDSKANLALTFVTRGDAERVSSLFAEVLNSCPSFALAHNGLACALFENGEYQKAESEVIAADSLCLTFYSVINAKVLTVVLAGQADPRTTAIALSFPDSAMIGKLRGGTIGGVASGAHSFLDFISPTIGPTIDGMTIVAGGMSIARLIGLAAVSATAAGGTLPTMATIAIGGGISLSISMIGPAWNNLYNSGRDAIITGINTLKQCLGEIGSWGGVYFKTSDPLKSGLNRGLVTEATLNYPRPHSQRDTPTNSSAND